MKKLTAAALVAAVFLAITLTVTSFASFAPTNVEKRNVNGVDYVIKTFEVASETDADTLTEPDFEDGGNNYTHYTTIAEDVQSAETKSVSETQTVESESNELADVLRKFPATLPYEADGFAGTLTLDVGSVVTEAAGYETRSSTISDIREYYSLGYEDAAALPQSVVKNGATLTLSDVTWTVTGTSLAGDSLVPSEYKATATYSKRVSSQVATGYVSTAVYRGEVSRSVTDAVIYTLTYIGTPLVTPRTNTGSC